MEITEAEQKKGKIKRNEGSLREFGTTLSILKFTWLRSQKEEREKGTENVFEDRVTENFPNLGKETDIQVQEAQRVPNRINPKRITTRHTVIKMAKIKDRES